MVKRCPGVVKRCFVVVKSCLEVVKRQPPTQWDRDIGAVGHR